MQLEFINFQNVFDRIRLWVVYKALNDVTAAAMLRKDTCQDATMDIKVTEDIYSAKKSLLTKLGIIFKQLYWEAEDIKFEEKLVSHLRFTMDVIIIGPNAGELRKMLESKSAKKQAK